MASFREKYSRLCRDNRVEPLHTILQQSWESCDDVGASSVKRRLDLSTMCLTVEQCAVLAKCLRNDDTFTDLKLTDCVLNDEGCKALCRGLKSNCHIRDLDLKGNNLRSGGAEALGNLLKHNNALRRLSLEWNCVGAFDGGVAYLAEGLAANGSLEKLDIRSNQVSHKGAEEIAAMLKKNATLKELDLRWNNCGVLGGRALLSALQQNKTLIQLDLTGNDVPNDIVKSIAVTLGRNVENQAMESQFHFQTTVLTREIKQLQQDSRIQISDLIEKLDHQKERFEQTSRSSQLKIGQLQESLAETSHEKELLESKYSMSEACVTVAEQKVKDLGDLVVRLKAEADDERREYKTELEKEKQRRVSIERCLSESVKASQEQEDDMNKQIQDLQIQLKKLNQHIVVLKSELEIAQQTNKHNLKESDEKLRQEEERHFKIVREMEKRHRAEEARLSEVQQSCEQTWQERFQQAESARFQKEQIILQLKTDHLDNKRRWDDETLRTVEQMKEAEKMRVRQLEEKILSVESDNRDLQSRVNNQASQVLELQSLVNSRDVEQRTLKRNLEESRKEADHRCLTIQAEVSRLQQSLDQRASQLEESRAHEKKLHENLAQLESEITVAVAQEKSKLLSKDTEIASLKEKLRKQALVFQQIREEEMRRAEQLQTAMERYLKSSNNSVIDPVFQ